MSAVKLYDKFAQGIMKICGYVLLVTSVTMLTVKDAGNALYEGVRELACSFELECCTSSWRPVNISRLEDLLDSHLLGQHLARDIVIRSMRAHHRPSPWCSASMAGQGAAKPLWRSLSQRASTPGPPQQHIKTESTLVLF